jgi:hypothetical protein
MVYGIGNPGPGMGQTQKCGGVKPVNWDRILPLLEDTRFLICRICEVNLLLIIFLPSFRKLLKL